MQLFAFFKWLVINGYLIKTTYISGFGVKNLEGDTFCPLSQIWVKLDIGLVRR